MLQDTNLQRRLLHDSLLHPHSPSWGACRRRRGHTSWWRGARHSNGNSCRSCWICSHFFELGPGWRSGRTTTGYCQRATIPMFGDSTRQQTHTWKTRLLALSACVPPDDPAGPKAEFRTTPRLVRGSCPSLPSLSFLLCQGAPVLRGLTAV
jgi:hypothetical protein